MDTLKTLVMALAGGDFLAGKAVCDFLYETADPRLAQFEHLRPNVGKVAREVNELRNTPHGPPGDDFVVTHTAMGPWRRGSVITMTALRALTNDIDRLVRLGAVRRAVPYRADPEGACDARGHWTPSRREQGSLRGTPYLQEMLLECRTLRHAEDLAARAASGQEVAPDVRAAFLAAWKAQLAGLFPEFRSSFLGG
jgi:hypothetical protein